MRFDIEYDKIEKLAYKNAFGTLTPKELEGVYSYVEDNLGVIIDDFILEAIAKLNR